MASSVPAAYYRGGTSKAVFFHEHDVPPPGALRDRFIRRVMGSPDERQIDGMGGARIVTSKASIIKTSERDDADLDYTFVQIGITDDTISYSANCGNISSAVGPFGISEGLVKTFRKGISTDPSIETREVRIFNTGTQKVLVAHVPIDPTSGQVLEEGSYAIQGVPGTAAPIGMDYRNTLGASCDKGLLPSGNIRDTIEVSGKPVEITICDVANLIVMVDAAAVGLTCTESAAEFNSNSKAIALCKEVRGKAAQLLGRCKDWQLVDEQSPMLPMVMAVAAYKQDNAADIAARLILDNRCHDSMAGTGSMCLAACTRIPGSVANRQLREGADQKHTLSIAHPIGVMTVSVITDSVAPSGQVTFRTLSFVRTARRIMTGVVHVPASIGLEENKKPADVHDKEADPAPAKPATQITRKLAEFVASTRYEDLPEAVVRKLKEFMIDNAGITGRAATIGESSPSFLKAVDAMNGHNGKSTVFTKGQGYGMETAALLNSAFSHTFDFDDTFAAGASHPGASLISVAYAQGEAMGASGKDILIALAVGYEVACRLAKALGTGGYARGFHNTATAGIFGSIAVLSKLKGLSADLVECGFGLGVSKAAGTMQFLDNGSWNKRLHPGFAARDSFLCVALAEAGVRGSSRAIEGTYGLLHDFSVSGQAVGLADDLGAEWVFMSTALKPFPACRMTHAPLELAAELSQEKKGEEVKSIEVHLSPSCWAIVGKPDPNKRHPVTTVDAQFSCYFQVANAWLHGAWTGWDAYQNIGEGSVHRLLDHIRCVADPAVPDLGTQLVVTWQDGAQRSVALAHPLGEQDRPFTAAQVRAKFDSLAVPTYGPAGAEQIVRTIEAIEQHSVADLMQHLK